MFNRFAAALHQAVEALAPSQSLLEDFIFHWKAITHYFINNKDEKCPVQESNISSHLDNMLVILEQEEYQTERNQTGPCMEHLLQHKILETLQTLGKADCPPGMKQLVLGFFTNLLGKIQQPLLPHVNVYKPVHRLIKCCGDVKAGPTEKEEIQFLCLVCAKLKETPYLINFFLEDPKTSSSSGRASRGGIKKKVSIDPSKMEFSLMNSLLSLVQSPDTRIAVKACEGMLLCASLPEKSSADCIVGNTHLADFLAERLCLLYNALPLSMDPVDVDSVEAKWGLDVSSDADDTNAFHGKRQLISLVSWFDYCDQVIKVAYSSIGDAVASALLDRFLLPILEPLLLQTSEVGILTSTSHLCKFVKMCESRQLLAVLVSFILGNDASEEQQHDLDQHKLRQRLIERCDHLSDEICIMSLKLFETLLLKSNEHVIKNLVLRNLETRAYYNRQPMTLVQAKGSENISSNSGNDRDNLSNGPENFEPELEFDDDFQTKRLLPTGEDSDFSSESGSPRKMTEEEEVQMGIHKLVNCFLILVPEEARSSLSGDVGYDMYLREAHRQFRDCTVNCLPYDWPNYVTPLEKCPPNPSFCEGAFLKVLFDKLLRMLDQPYEVNLQVTSVIAKIALFPHPHIQEYFLDPFLPAAPGCRTLFTVLSKVVSDLSTRASSISDFQKQVMLVRRQLMGLVEDQQNLPYIDLLEGVIVLEEFCKELAAVTFVKHHASSER
ncbi:FHF complex subunit HOOK interacting protein 2A-like isoform X2 [Apostichopus japonicus]|uniref:FHF complex subunit HOOK interacting protein 2A-like isoform X2 n=1 Tax=Stichopus japonicus TaxID=307972 RepID=UPI003AB646BE